MTTETTLLNSESHTTQAHSQRIAEMAAKTVPGMAHWAGSGPAGKTCRECSECTTHGYYSKGRKANGGLLKPVSCDKYKEMMRGAVVRFGHDREACRFFIEAAQPLSMKAV